MLIFVSKRKRMMTKLAVLVLAFTSLTHIGHRQKLIEKITPIIIEKSDKYNLEPEMVAAIIQVESSWHPKSESEAGACGLMQVIPKWNPKPDGSLYTCEELKNPEVGIEAGTKAFRWWLDRSSDNIPLALCSYNAGYTCFKKMKHSYVKRVMNVYHTIKKK